MLNKFGPASSDRQWQGNNIILSNDLNLRGVSCAKKGDHLEALLNFLGAVLLNPNNAKAWYNCGTSLTKIGKFDEQTIECFNRTIEICPEDPDAWINKAAILEYIGKNEEAMTCYQRALETRPGHKRATNGIGHLLIKLGHPKEGERYLKKAGPGFRHTFREAIDNVSFD